MGSGVSSLPGLKTTHLNVSRSTSDIVALLMPVYFLEDDPTQEDVTLATKKWNMIIDDKSEHFKRKKGSPGYHQASCIMLFYDSFYMRLFDIHPLAKPMFKSGLKSQGKFLVKMISLAVSILFDRPKFTETMTGLAETHNTRGVKAIEYGIVGDVLFWALRRCLGHEYDSVTHRAWVRIFCAMLKVIVPLAIQHELRNGEAQIDRLRVMQEEKPENSQSTGPSTNIPGRA